MLLRFEQPPLPCCHPECAALLVLPCECAYSLFPKFSPQDTDSVFFGSGRFYTLYFNNNFLKINKIPDLKYFPTNSERKYSFNNVQLATVCLRNGGNSVAFRSNKSLLTLEGH